MNTGESPNVEWLFQQAVDSGQWDLVLQLIERGVSAALRTSLLQCALGHQNVQCTATLMDLGVSKHCREEGLRQQIAAGHGDFVLEVVRKVRDPDLTDFVLRESLKQSQWPLVSGLVKEGLSVAQMESVCDNAVADQQWTVALQLLRDGVSPSERMVSELFQNNKAQDLLDLFPVGSIPDGLKGLLLLACVRFHQGDLTQHVLQRESVSDSQLMEAIKLAVHLKDKTAFLLLIRDCPKSCRIFKQKFVHQQWKEQPSKCYDGEVRWIYDVLYEGGEKDLALFVVTSGKTTCPCIADFCRHEWKQLSVNSKRLSYVFTKVLEFDHKNYHLLVKEKYAASETSESVRSLLFCHTLQMEEYSLTLELCTYGVLRKDLKFAFRYLVQGGVNWGVFRKMQEQLNWEEHWLRLYTLNLSMKTYFEERSDANLNIFIVHFIDCDSHCGLRFISRMFRKAVTKCVELDLADCFAMLCVTHQIVGRSVVRSDLGFAFDSAVNRNRPLLISKLCNGPISWTNCHNELVNIILEREAWHLLSCVSAADLRFLISDKGLGLLERCVLKMLSDQQVWPDIAPALDEWIRRCGVNGGRLIARVTIMARLWLCNVSRVTQWCVDNGHSNLAFFLALVTEDMEMLTTMVTAYPSLDLDHNWLWPAMILAADHGKLSTGAALLKQLPVNRNTAKEYWEQTRPLTDWSGLSSACEEQGLTDWALVVMAKSSSYVLEKHQLSQNPELLNFLMDTAVRHIMMDVVRALMPRCNDLGIFQDALKWAMFGGEKSLVEELLNKVDPSSFRCIYYDRLLFGPTLHSDKVRDDMVRLSISAGLSSFERELQRGVFEIENILDNVQTTTFKRLLASGAFSNKLLHTLRKHQDWREAQKEEDEEYEDDESEEWKESCIWIREAASTPCRLEHLARLAVSHSIGCQPGRSQRIHSLPVPEPVKDLLRFKDVVSVDFEEEEEEEEM